MGKGSPKPRYQSDPKQFQNENIFTYNPKKRPKNLGVWKYFLKFKGLYEDLILIFKKGPSMKILHPTLLSWLRFVIFNKQLNWKNSPDYSSSFFVLWPYPGYWCFSFLLEECPVLGSVPFTQIEEFLEGLIASTWIKELPCSIKFWN